MAVTWPRDADCPVDASAFVTYGNSEDPTSVHTLDQTRRFSAKQWIPMRFCEDDVLASPELHVTRLSSHDEGRDPGDEDDGAGDAPGQHGRDRAAEARERGAAGGPPGGQGGRPVATPPGDGEPDRAPDAAGRTTVRAAAASVAGAVPAGSGALLVLALVTSGLAGALSRRRT
jgi:hypothetical protein